MKWTVEKKIAAGFGLLLAILLAVGLLSYRNTLKLIRDGNLVAHSHEVLDELDGTLSSVKDAETGQRGFVITGDEGYLQPFTAALPAIGRHLMRLKGLTEGDAAQRRSLGQLESRIADRLALIHDSIELRKASGFAAAEQVISSGRGKRI